jgi:hypothetical protein
MPAPVPRLIRDGLEALSAAVGPLLPEGLNAASWSQLQKILPRVREQRVLAVGLAALLGEHLVRKHQGFWFPQREALHGFEIGFPDTLLAVSPFELVKDALARSDVASLSRRETELADALARAGAGNARLSPTSYQKLFDPGFVQFLAIDAAAARRAWDTPAQRLAAHLEAVLAAAPLLPDVRERLWEPWVGALRKLGSGATLWKQGEGAPRLLERVGHLYGTVATTAAAAEELWADVAFPLLLIGSPAAIGAVPAAALESGEPFGALLSTLPRRFKPPPEGVLGVFSFERVRPVNSLRLYEVDLDELSAPLEEFDPRGSRAFLERFKNAFEAQLGKPARLDRDRVMEQAVSALETLKKIWATRAGAVWLRRLTGAEALAEADLDLLRQLVRNSLPSI